MKGSFVLYAEYLENIELLSMEQRGVLITALMKYVSGLDIPDMDAATTIAFSFIRSKIDKDQKKYEEVCSKRAGLARWGADQKKQKVFQKSKINQKKQMVF